MTRQLIIYALIAGLLVLLGLMGAKLPRDLRALSTAETDNTQWTIVQAETEFANLSAALAQEESRAVPDSDALRLRTDIALSRLGLIREGRNRGLWAGNEDATRILAMLDDFAGDAVAIVDRPGALTIEDVGRLREITDAARPDVRRLAVLGLTLGAAAEEARREAFAQQLRRIGAVAMVLLTSLTAALLFLDRVLVGMRRKDAEIRATTERLAATVAASLDGIIIADGSGTIVDYNAAAARIFGWNRDEILGCKLEHTIVPHDKRAAHATGMARYLATGTRHVIDGGRMEMTAMRKTGEEFPVELNITSARRDGSELFIAYLRDISQRKINERELIDARDRAESADRAKSQFLTVMSHEMRTPLNGILGVLDLLKTTALDKTQERFVEVAAASGEILLENVNEALDITRIESGVMSLSPTVFPLRATVFRVADVLRTLALEKGLTLVVDFDPSMDRLFHADGGRINQILTNLIGNAIKFTETGGITLEVRGIHGPDETVATFAVHDTGPGIPADRLEDIFADFIALARSGGRQTRGDGLGLSISRKVARLMGGDLKAESISGAGSLFTLTVPLERVRPEEPDGAPKQPPVSVAVSASVSPKRVLIVEDNAINRSVLREMLAKFGHDVWEAEDGQEGVATAEESRFDLIIMDISMPVMDGIEATRRIRAGGGPNTATYILGLTAHGREEYRVKATEAGMDGFCTKPLRLPVLRATLAGIGAPDEEAVPGSGTLAIDVIGDLRQTLGDAMTRATVDRFFAELDASLPMLREVSPGDADPAISETLHKLRGAAGMLGLQSVEQAIDRVSAACKTTDRDAFEAALDEIGPVAASASEAVVRALGCPKG